MTEPAETTEAVRRFNRFYTRQIGVLNEGFLQSPFSLTQGRVLYELAHQAGPTATELSTALGLDTGYLSRILRRFERQGLLQRERSRADGRRSHLGLTAKGRAAIAGLDARSQEEVRGMLGHLSEPDQRRLLESMRTIERLLGAPVEPAPGYLLRPHQPGDMG